MSALQIGPAGIKRVLFSLAAAAAMVLTAPSSAQFGLAGGIGEAFKPAYTTRDIQLAVDMLKLDDAQKFIVETLFEDYDAEFRTGVDGFRERVASLRTEIDPGNPDPGQIMRVVFGTINEWQQESRQLGNQLTADIKGLLNAEQLETWPAFQRKLFRLKYLRNGQLPGENVDLLNDVIDLRLDPSQTEQLRGLIEQYEVALDDALRRRENYLQSSQNELINAIQAEDYGKGIEVAQRQVELRKAVRDVNEQYTLAIAAALPTGIGDQFVRTIRQRTYPRVFRVTPAERTLKAAEKLEDISEETREAVIELQQLYQTELESFNEQLVQMIRDHKPAEIKHKVEQASARLSGAVPQQLVDPTRDEFIKRREVGNRYIDQLKALLTPEQFASLPGARRWLQEDGPAALAGKESPALRAKRSRLSRAPNTSGATDAPPIASPGTPKPGEDSKKSTEKKTKD